MLEFLLSNLLTYQYPILFWVMISASIGIPIPATALLMAAAAFVSNGYFDIEVILIGCFISAVFGDFFLYGISRKFGHTILCRLGFRKILASSGFQSLEKTFLKNSSTTIFISRFLTTSFGPLVSILAGLSKTPFWKFTLFGILGECLYVFIFAGLWYAFGDQWETISDLSGNIIIVVILIILLFFLLRLVLKKKGKKKLKKA